MTGVCGLLPFFFFGQKRNSVCHEKWQNVVADDMEAYGWWREKVGRRKGSVR